MTITPIAATGPDSPEPIGSTTSEPVGSTTSEPVGSTTSEPVGSTTSEPIGPGSPGSDDLVRRLASELSPPVGGWVDLLHLAAHLEARGLTDDAARTAYGAQDVFALAQRVAQVPSADIPESPASADRHASGIPRATWLHGIIYLLPAPALPATLAWLDTRDATVALGAGGAFGWIWVGCTAPVAFHLRGVRREHAAARWMLLVTCLGLVLAAVTSIAVALLLPGHRVVVLGLVFAMATFQVATAHEFFHHRRAVVPVMMAPAVVLGGLYLVLGRPADLRTAVAGTLVACCAALIGLAIVRGVRDCRSGADDENGPLIPSVPRHIGVCLLTTISAAYLLGTQLRFFLTSAELAVSMVGLLVSMGVVEWRTLALADASRRLLNSSTDLNVFHRALSRRVGRELLTTILVAGAASLVAAWVMSRTLGLSPQGVIALTGASLLSGAYLLTFILTNIGRTQRLIGAFLSASFVTFLVPAITGLGVAIAFLASSTLLIASLGHAVLREPARSFQ